MLRQLEVTMEELKCSDKLRIEVIYRLQEQFSWKRLVHPSTLFHILIPLSQTIQQKPRDAFISALAQYAYVSCFLLIIYMWASSVRQRGSMRQLKVIIATIFIVLCYIIPIILLTFLCIFNKHKGKLHSFEA
ncbi:MAG: hypothetical protein EZS28_004854, partial [Streblomastix strix]